MTGLAKGARFVTGLMNFDAKFDAAKFWTAYAPGCLHGSELEQAEKRLGTILNSTPLESCPSPLPFGEAGPRHQARHRAPAARMLVGLGHA